MTFIKFNKVSLFDIVKAIDLKEKELGNKLLQETYKSYQYAEVVMNVSGRPATEEELAPKLIESEEDTFLMIEWNLPDTDFGKFAYLKIDNKLETTCFLLDESK